MGVNSRMAGRAKREPGSVGKAHLETYCWMQSKLPWGLSRPMLER